MSGGPVRQLSLHLPPSTKSGGPLRKQRSVDADRPWTSAGCNSGLRVTASSILTGGHFPQEAVITRSTSGISITVLFLFSSSRVYFSLGTVSLELFIFELDTV